jgi:HK97 family phage prohead protease
MQTKTLDFGLEIKAVSDSGQVEGWAARYGNVDRGGDVIEIGAFKNHNGPVPMLWGHDTMQPIGIWDELGDAPGGRQGGLYAKGRMFPDDDPLARRILTLVKNKAVNGMSIGYRVPPGGSEPDERRPGVRRLKAIELLEVSLVTFPMNELATVTSCKSIFEAGEMPTERDLERALRDELFFPNRLAKAIASAAKPHLRRDVEQAPAPDAADFGKALLRLISSP